MVHSSGKCSSLTLDRGGFGCISFASSDSSGRDRREELHFFFIFKRAFWLFCLFQLYFRRACTICLVDSFVDEFWGHLSAGNNEFPPKAEFPVSYTYYNEFCSCCNLSTCVNSSTHFFCLASSGSAASSSLLSLPEESEGTKEMHPNMADAFVRKATFKLEHKPQGLVISECVFKQILYHSKQIDRFVLFMA